MHDDARRQGLALVGEVSQDEPDHEKPEKRYDAFGWAQPRPEEVHARENRCAHRESRERSLVLEQGLQQHAAKDRLLDECEACAGNQRRNDDRKRPLGGCSIMRPAEREF
ncbi:hypothetical protein D3C87_1765740 [compost metagenome]